MKIISFIIIICLVTFGEVNADLSSDEFEELKDYEIWFYDGKKWISLDITIGDLIKYVLYLFPEPPPCIEKEKKGVILKVQDKEILFIKDKALLSSLGTIPKIVYVPVSIKSEGGTFDKVGAAAFIWQIIYDYEAKTEQHKISEK